MNSSDLDQTILSHIAKCQTKESKGVAAGLIQQHINRPRATINRALARLVASGHLFKLGAGRSIAYQTNTAIPFSACQKNAEYTLQGARNDRSPVHAPSGFKWSKKAQALVAELTAPLGTRKPISYQKTFIECYIPNQSALLAPSLASELFQTGKAKDQLPAGTYARKVLEQLLIDLSWSSSRLEGNRKSLLDTRALFEQGKKDFTDLDAVMLLNHKEAIEFIVDAVPMEGLSMPVIRNVQSILMQNLLDDPNDLGSIRRKIVNIQDTVYTPIQMPQVLEDLLGIIVNKACQIRNPVEAAFFLWVHIAYLQPFVDGNKRTSRLAANIPFLLCNCAPLSFLDVGQQEYALAMIAVYEKQDVMLASELFAWTYRRSMARYQVVIESMGAPNPMRIQYRETLGVAIRQIVLEGLTIEATMTQLDIPNADQDVFLNILDDELNALQTYNCARYQLSMQKTAEWIKKGRLK